jgi:hypothetical protein
MFFPGLFLELGDLLRDVALDQGGVPPIHRGQRRGDDVLRRVVDVVRERVVLCGLVGRVGRELLVRPASSSIVSAACMLSPTNCPTSSVK